MRLFQNPTEEHDDMTEHLDKQQIRKVNIEFEENAEHQEHVAEQNHQNLDLIDYQRDWLAFQEDHFHENLEIHENYDYDVGYGVDRQELAVRREKYVLGKEEEVDDEGYGVVDFWLEEVFGTGVALAEVKLRDALLEKVYQFYELALALFQRGGNQENVRVLGLELGRYRHGMGIYKFK